jgi:hypothetical protein
VTLRTHNKELQRIQAISRMPADTLDDTIKAEFSNLLQIHCSWAETIDAGEIPENAVFYVNGLKLKSLEELKTDTENL